MRGRFSSIFPRGPCKSSTQYTDGERDPCQCFVPKWIVSAVLYDIHRIFIDLDAYCLAKIKIKNQHLESSKQISTGALSVKNYCSDLMFPLATSYLCKLCSLLSHNK